MRNILYKKYPEYYDFDYVFNKRNLIYVFNKAHFYNMFIMKKEVFLEYTEWLFDILFECEQQIQISQHPYQARVF